MATKKPTTVTQLRKEIKALKDENYVKSEGWRSTSNKCLYLEKDVERLTRELAIASARCMKLKGIVEYLEDQLKNDSK